VGDAVSTNLEEHTQTMILREQGNYLENKSDSCILFVPRLSGTEAYSYGIENRTSVDMEITFSVVKGKNLAFSTPSAIVKKIVPANGFEFLMHTRKEDLTRTDYKFEYTYRHV